MYVTWGGLKACKKAADEIRITFANMSKSSGAYMVWNNPIPSETSCWVKSGSKTIGLWMTTSDTRFKWWGDVIYHANKSNNFSFGPLDGAWRKLHCCP